MPARVARLAVALAGAEAPGLLPEERALATLEALAIARNVGLFNELSTSSERLMQAAANVAGLTTSQLDRLGRSSRTAAADACENAAAWVPDEVEHELRRVAAHLRTNREQLARAARFAAASPPVELQLQRPSARDSRRAQPQRRAEPTVVHSSVARPAREAT